MRRAFLAILLPVFSFALMFGAQQASALRLSLKRVVFEGAQRADVLTLVNDSAEEQTYRLSWQEMKMTADRPLTVLADGAGDPAVRPARAMVVFAPRRVTIPPGGSQQIRLMLRKPADLQDGEYRSHLAIVPEREAIRPEQEEAAGQTRIALKMLAGVSVPVIVRHGNLSAAASLEDVRVTQEGGHLSLSLSVLRQGERSLYGDFSLYCTGQDQPVYQLRGIAVYPELEARPLKFTFPVPAQDCRALRVAYRSPQNDPVFRGKVIAEAVTPLQ